MNRNTGQVLLVGSSQAPHHPDESRARLCPPQTPLSVTSNRAPRDSDENRTRLCPPEAQEQVWVPLQTR